MSNEYVWVNDMYIDAMYNLWQQEHPFDESGKPETLEDLEYAYFEQFTGDDWQDFQEPIPF